MSLSIHDAQVFSVALKKARKKKHLTQSQCAEHWISLRMTVSSKTTMTEQALHTKNF